MKKLIFLLSILALILFSTSCTQNLNAPEVTDYEFSVDENSPAGTIIGVIIAYDLDEGQSVSFEIVDGNEKGTFEIDHLGGHLSIADPMLLDYELNTRLELTISVTDDHPKDPMESTSAVSVQVSDLNEFAPVVEDQTFEIGENPIMGDQIGIIAATDQETHQGLHYTIMSGNKAAIFSLDSASGALTVNDPSAFDLNVNQQFVLVIQVRDIHLDSKTDTAKITIKLIPG